ncbi:hypothetical protein TREMEDRAFT_31189 [Tremella mesenterica DSM 1558]|uniref:uncharacterized protein n=1 Tax=Tremella mesenterica (strain ATCC 24925 / CBS 8224 / DSM 1558 / NBRC 9311 / NRRL Y-6157 / RJB 2259-6 / UBC 559-6) TaxID=578456 RepID=UPI0003F49AD9|nr:uncharacterized protein TREMEDRAFT_31189 [Tremella mesenterica DSM 1558]EIW69103.1 hypothetical protein TREMEDRAFT_31189 [Tremella mesenterica DSM 1558]
MPSCRVTNLTTHKLNICLKQVTALHFENGVEPGQTVKFKPGKVWFTFEALVDDGEKKTRYSILKSAATIALLSVAVGAAVATAGVALLPEAAALEAAAAASIAGGFIAKGMIITKGALIAHSGSIAKLSSIALPRTIDRLSAELGGLTALQREVLSIIASPTLSSDVRTKALSLLSQLHTAYTADKAQSTQRQIQNVPTIDPPASSTISKDTSFWKTSLIDPTRKSDKPLPIPPSDDRVEGRAIRTGEILRIHGIYMNKRREFEVRSGEKGRLELWDKSEGKMVG